MAEPDQSQFKAIQVTIQGAVFTSGDCRYYLTVSVDKGEDKVSKEFNFIEEN